MAAYSKPTAQYAPPPALEGSVHEIYPSYFKLLRVAAVRTAESHSVSVLIDGLNFAPTSNSNYFGYVYLRKSQIQRINAGG